MAHPLRSIIGAILGGILGHLATAWLIKQGFYSVAFPGALIGFGAIIGQVRGALLPILYGLAALTLGYYTEWTHFPFTKNRTFGYFLQHLGELKPLTHIMVLLGAVMAFWMPFRRRIVPRGKDKG